MPRIQYVERRFSEATIRIINQANSIIEEYSGQGFDLTLRQLYYQFVSRDLIENNDREYKRLGSIVNDARLAGLIDWDHITDRTRTLRAQAHFESPTHIIQAAANQFAIDKWATQPCRVEVWIEKDALIGVIAGECTREDVPYFSCRGYTSQSEMWSAAQRLEQWVDAGQTPMILHLGDHDPSGIDMSRDIFDRLELFMGGTQVKRLALNMDQITRFRPPPNPAKVTDARASGYIKKFGSESWELDALSPPTIVGLIRDAIQSVRNTTAWYDAVRRETEFRSQIQSVSECWPHVVANLPR